MTTRHAGYLVVLEESIREDDAANIIAAIKMIKGVVSVKPVESSIELQLAIQRARHELAKKLWKVLEEV